MVTTLILPQNQLRYRLVDGLMKPGYRLKYFSCLELPYMMNTPLTPALFLCHVSYLPSFPCCWGSGVLFGSCPLDSLALDLGCKGCNLKKWTADSIQQEQVPKTSETEWWEGTPSDATEHRGKGASWHNWWVPADSNGDAYSTACSVNGCAPGSVSHAHLLSLSEDPGNPRYPLLNMCCLN